MFAIVPTSSPMIRQGLMKGPKVSMVDCAPRRAPEMEQARLSEIISTVGSLGLAGFVSEQLLEGLELFHLSSFQGCNHLSPERARQPGPAGRP